MPIKDLPQAIKDFIKNPVTAINVCLPHHYPETDSFEEFQMGYKYHALTGEDLTGTEPGDFRKNDYVVCVNAMDDPYYVDILEEKQGFPVYFAWHGAGNWTRIDTGYKLADLTLFLQQLTTVEDSKDEVLAFLKTHTDLTNELWKEVFDGYNEMDNADDQTTETQDTTTWIPGKLIITNVGKNKLSVVKFLKKEMGLTPQQALTITKQEVIEVKEGYLVHLQDTLNYLTSLGASVEFRVNDTTTNDTTR